MDRRQRKTRDAIFKAFIELLSKKDLNHITVEEIITRADVGRATFYAHFETKDYLLKALCEELFCHIFDSTKECDNGHKHIFNCDAPDSVFLHLFKHLQKNDNHILDLLSCPNNELFLRYFKNGLVSLIENQYEFFEKGKAQALPKSFWVNHIASTFVETIWWWMENERQETPETITNYFLLSLHSTMN
ncbi:MAG: TetR/AcrR family transcriptional regulator [Clostridia bacterium]|nr:TetR/AcrR family transcriptional regulator [Clostridia bacterium]